MFYLNLFQNRSKRLEKVHVVIGHKSCDLDSLISAFTYAYFLSLSPFTQYLSVPLKALQQNENQALQSLAGCDLRKKPTMVFTFYTEVLLFLGH